MEEATLRRLLVAVQAGELAPDDAVAQLRRLPFAELGYARGRPPPRAPPGPARGGLRAGQDAGAVRRDRRRAAGPRRRAGAAHPGRRCAARGGARRAPRRPVQHRAGGLVWRPSAPRPERVVVVSRRHGRLPVADECAAVLAAHGFERGAAHRRRRRRPAPAARRHDDLADAPTRSSSSPAWRARWPAWSAASPPRRWSPCPTSVGYGAVLEGVTALLGDARVVRGRGHRRRHRQRLRRGLRRAADAA